MTAVSFVVPLHNDEFEGMLFVQSLVNSFANKDGCEIVLVDNGSTDGTLSRMHELAINYPQIKLIYYAQNQGIGYAVKMGVSQASGDKIIVLDAKTGFSLKTVEEMFLKLNSVDVVFGKRSEPVNFVEKSAVYLFSFVASVFFGKKSDYFCIVHAFNRNVKESLFKNLFMHCDLFPIELLYKIQRCGLSTVEVQVGGVHGDLKKYSFIDNIKLPVRLFLLRMKLLRV